MCQSLRLTPGKGHLLFAISNLLVQDAAVILTKRNAAFECCLLLMAWLTAGPAPAADGAAPSGPRAVWLGQDGHDFCQTATSLKPNDIQDLHLRLEGLPAEEVIDGLLIRRAGGGEWACGSKGGRWTWKAHLVRETNGTAADLFLEPSHDEQQFRVDFELRYRSGREARFSLNCGRSNPNLFMPAATVSARWVGQDGNDWTGPGPAVGPDGFEDARIELMGLSTKLELKSIVVENVRFRGDLPAGQEFAPSDRSPPDHAGAGWEYGLNPDRRSNAELVRDPKDRSRGSLFFSPDRDLNEAKLRLRVTYSIERSTATDLLAGPTAPKRAMPKPPEIQLAPNQLSTRWLGQDGQDPIGRGDVHLAVKGLAAGREILAAALSDRVGGCWTFRRDPKVSFFPATSGGPASALLMRRAPRAATADLFFQPFRDEAGTPMVLRLLLDDGTTTVHRFAGQACDPFQRGPLPASGSVEPRPGDDLNALAEKFGTIRLARGHYALNRPLRLGRPITITGERDAVVAFSQKPDEPPWRGAILIGAGNVTLRGFAVRFAAGFRWASQAPNGAGIIHTFDQPGSQDPKANIVLEKLDIESSSVPPPEDPKQPTEAPYLARLAGATSGKIVGNRFRGGTVDVANGPWLIADNDHRGTVPGTVAWDAFGGHWLHDFTLERNRVRADGPSGKIWRFISMNQLGQRVVIRGNDVSGVGMRDDDTIPNPNAPEILLTESYRLYFEGRPASVSRDGFVLQVPMIMHGTVRPGSLVSILSGAHAGRWFAIAQPLTPTAFLMAEALPAGDYAISIAHGFVDCVFEQNRIDVRGGKSAVVVLAGNHWGLRLLKNRLLGGGDSLLAQSTPTEDPFIWGWSHTPFLDFLGEGNIHEDSARGISIDVHSDRHNKTTAGRTYLTGICRDNTIQWSASPPGMTNPTPAFIRIGSHSGEDTGQMKLDLTGNGCRGAPPGEAVLTIRHAIINGQPVPERASRLPVMP